MTRDDIDPAALADVADWAPLSIERKAELRRILLGGVPPAKPSPASKPIRRRTT